MTDSISAFGRNTHESSYLKPFDLDKGEDETTNHLLGSSQRPRVIPSLTYNKEWRSTYEEFCWV